MSLSGDGTIESGSRVIRRQEDLPGGHTVEGSFSVALSPTVVPQWLDHAVGSALVGHRGRISNDGTASFGLRCSHLDGCIEERNIIIIIYSIII